MTCAQVQKMLPALVEGVLSKTETALAEEHLTTCPDCKTLFEEFQRARQLVGNLEEIDPPPGFAQRILARVEEEEGRKGGILRKLFYPLHIKVPIQAVAMVAVAVLAIQAYRAVDPQKRMASQMGVATAPDSEEESGKREDRREEAVQTAKKALPTPEQASRAAERTAKDTPASSPPEENRLQQDKTVEFSQTPAASPAPRETAKAEPAAPGKRAKMEIKAKAPAPSTGAASLQKKAPIELTLQAMDPVSAGEKVWALLQEFGASRVEKRRLGEGEVVTAELDPERLPRLLELLRALGEMPEKPRVFEPASAAAYIRIEIVRK